MFKNVVFYQSETGSGSSAAFIMPGIFLVLFGLLIIAMPELLAVIGCGIFYHGRRLFY